MAGTKLGGLHASITNKERYGQDYYIRIGAIGGKKTGLKGFALNIDCNCNELPGTHYLRQCSGKKGGRYSRRNRVI